MDVDDVDMITIVKCREPLYVSFLRLLDGAGPEKCERTWCVCRAGHSGRHIEVEREKGTQADYGPNRARIRGW